MSSSLFGLNDRTILAFSVLVTDGTKSCQLFLLNDSASSSHVIFMSLIDFMFIALWLLIPAKINSLPFSVLIEVVVMIKCFSNESFEIHFSITAFTDSAIEVWLSRRHRMRIFLCSDKSTKICAMFSVLPPPLPP